jgi:CheY-like chemotaxis protein
LKPDLIVADITMPLLNGIDAASPDQEKPARHEIGIRHDACEYGVLKGRV